MNNICFTVNDINMKGNMRNPKLIEMPHLIKH